MREILGDLFSHSKTGPDAVCITTNGVVGSRGANVMGRGCAAKAKELWPGIESLLGRRIQEGGNRVHLLTEKLPDHVEGNELQLGLKAFFQPDKHHVHYLPYHIVSFPTKNGWRDPSDLQLIEDSARQLVELADLRGWESIVLPRPGCGYGQLKWEEVRSILSDILDDRFWVISFA